MSEHWQEIARQWELVGPPLRPAPEDVAFAAAALRGWERDHGPARKLILGVTPELCRAVQDGGHLLAVDHTRAMIDAIWRGPRRCVSCAEWTALPLPSASRDVAFCDGGLHLLSYPDEQSMLAGSLARVLAPGGLFVIRLFVPPGRPEIPADVLADLLTGRIASLNVLKLRLGMSMQPEARVGVQLSSVWDAIHAAAPDFGALAERIGWDVQHLLAINTYRDCPRRYHFVTVDQATATFAAAGFELQRIDRPASYDLCGQCPTIILRRRAN